MKRKLIVLVLLVLPSIGMAAQWASPDASKADKCALLGLIAYTVVHDRAQGMTPDGVLNDVWSQCKQSPHATAADCSKFAQRIRGEVIAIYRGDVELVKSFGYTSDPNSPVNVERRAQFLKKTTINVCFKSNTI
jgi:hypothetical protein